MALVGMGFGILSEAFMSDKKNEAVLREASKETPKAAPKRTLTEMPGLNLPGQRRRGALLGVNVDHVATIRQARHTRYPDPVQAGLIAASAGADSITVHLREDRRHIQQDDVWALKRSLQIPLNLEMAVIPQMIALALQARPEKVCLVPERREELTTEGGLDVLKHADAVSQACERLGEAGIEVSLFIEPDIQQIEAAQRAGAPAIELHTGTYADAEDAQARGLQLERIREAGEAAASMGLIVNAGHGLNLGNVVPVAAFPWLHELNIGHSLIADALFVGLKQAIHDMLNVLEEAACV